MYTLSTPAKCQRKTMYQCFLLQGLVFQTICIICISTLFDFLLTLQYVTCNLYEIAFLVSLRRNSIPSDSISLNFDSSEKITASHKVCCPQNKLYSIKHIFGQINQFSLFLEKVRAFPISNELANHISSATFELFSLMHVSCNIQTLQLSKFKYGALR